MLTGKLEIVRPPWYNNMVYDIDDMMELVWDEESISIKAKRMHSVNI
jgi:hypothetical protein